MGKPSTSSTNVQSITVPKPGESKPIELQPNTDSTLWSNTENLAGDYEFTVVDNVTSALMIR